MKLDEIRAECFFLDVGQGSSQVIDLGDRSAIVIDCGRTPYALCQHLDDIGITRLAMLILSHNHADHMGGAIGLVRKFRGCIDAVRFLQDRPAPEMEKLGFYTFLWEEAAQGNIPEPMRLERPVNCLLYPPPDADTVSPIRLELLFPGFMENIRAQSDEPNATSAVLVLHCGKTRVLYPGDAEIEAWRNLVNTRKEPIKCNVLAVPHHGGQIVRRRRSNETKKEFYEAIRPDLEWIYAEAIRAEYAIVSVGSNNTHGHPLPCHIEALNAEHGILCTQITEQCCDNLERLRPGVLSPQWAGNSVASRSKTKTGRSRDVACAGTILIQLGTETVEVDRFTDHQRGVTKLAETGSRPLCRSQLRIGRS